MSPLKPLEEIPKHLRHYITEQDYSLYTSIDHAVWRYILKLSKSFFKDHAHEKYLSGLEETGISTERIPKISEMDEKLRKFGWRAIGVVGFIPPAAFMEFQSLGVLPIACDMRNLEHLAYTPAPDIVHEAAGHAPIIADPEYAAYLRNYGQVSRKAIFSDKDMAIYYAIRNLSDIKENPKSTPKDIENAQNKLDDAITDNNYISEAAYLARMNWWTVEYGLVGDLAEPKIYGAGLLSSVGESTNCLNEKIRKIPFSVDCLNTSYDITKPQPQLFVTPDFEALTEVLENYSATMAFKKGGGEGLAKAKMAQNTVTCELDSEIQMSGTLSHYITDSRACPAYLQFKGPCQLALHDKQLEGHGPKTHSEGYGTPVGKLKGRVSNPSYLTPKDLEEFGFRGNQKGTLEFTSGVIVEGVLTDRLEVDGRNLILSFNHCKVQFRDQILFEPSWGSYDMACGVKVTSVFGGAADRGRFLEETNEAKYEASPQKTNQTDDNKDLIPLYQKVREIREQNKDYDALSKIHDQLENRFPNDWLLRMDLLELNQQKNLNASWKKDALKRVREIAKKLPDTQDLIRRGLKLINEDL